jgi:hypothetical protein
MISYDSTLEEIKGRIALSCEDGMDARALIFAADSAARMGAAAVSCNPESVNMLWTWLEKSGIKIYVRIDVCESEPDPQRVAAQINSAFKKGAAGAHLVASPKVLDKLAERLVPVAADLFFSRELILVADLAKIRSAGLEGIFHNIKMLNAAGFGISAGQDERAAGVLYEVLDDWDSDFRGVVHIMAKDPDLRVVEDAWRLAGKMRPDAAQRMMFFLRG